MVTQCKEPRIQEVVPASCPRHRPPTAPRCPPAASSHLRKLAPGNPPGSRPAFPELREITPVFWSRRKIRALAACLFPTFLAQIPPQIRQKNLVSIQRISNRAAQPGAGEGPE